MSIVWHTELPVAIVVSADAHRTMLATSWRSPRGLHIITMCMPTGNVLSDDQPELLENALHDFLMLVGSEANG